MLGKVLRLIFGAIGIVTGYTIANTLVIRLLSPEADGFKIPIYVALCLTFGALLFFIAGKLFDFFNNIIGKAESTASDVSFYEIIIGTGGLIIGLIIANLAAIPFKDIPVVGSPTAILFNIVFGAGGMYFAIKNKDEINFDAFKKRKNGDGTKILDTCILIDGRIIDIIKSGFVEGRILIPTFIIKEMQVIADSSDSVKRGKGRRGLDVLENLVKDFEYAETIETEFDESQQETDVKLLKYASKIKGRILTTDYNLNKVAAVTGVGVMNLNELASAIKKLAYPGEKLYITISKPGKENDQGIGYLEDGAMVIVENGREHIGSEKEVVVTSVTQTSAGRLIFSKIE
ncbi:MAG: TRAM domain-containing protein [Clostridiales bacterium]|nr:TRAM domain-containing protein [Clostridiales bacterium]